MGLAIAPAPAKPTLTRCKSPGPYVRGIGADRCFELGQLDKLSLRHRRASSRERSRASPARPAASAAPSRARSRRAVPAWSRRISTPRAAASVAAELGEVAISARGRRARARGRHVGHHDARRCYTLRRRRRGRVERRHRVQRRARARPRSKCGIATTTSSRAGTFSSHARPRAPCEPRAWAAASSSSDRRTRSPPARTPRRTPPRRQRRCMSRAASREELGPSRIRVNTVNPDAVLEGSGIRDSAWRERARPCVRHRGRRPRRPLPRAHARSRCNVVPRGHRRGGPVRRLPAARHEEHGQRPQRRRRRRARLSAPR